MTDRQKRLIITILQTLKGLEKMLQALSKELQELLVEQNKT